MNLPQPILSLLVYAIALCGLVASGLGQTTGASVQGPLEQRIQTAEVSAFQLQSYLAKRIPKLPSPASAEQWRSEEQNCATTFSSMWLFTAGLKNGLKLLPSSSRLRSLRPERDTGCANCGTPLCPVFESTAILYEPEKISGKAPAVLNLIGHEVAGNAAEYEQKRCINFAKKGILALSMAWVGFGELAQPENAHDYGAHLDLVGANALGFFYLSMRRGLDYLATLPQVDPRRLGVTGLSGGGWQTVMLGALDERVAVSVEVAGIGALEANLVRPLDLDEIEENATDLASGEDYPLFVAMRAPRPTLLIHNAEDSCCFRAALVKPYIYDRIQPFFRLFGEADEFGWHENRDPGTHNYQLDNREHAYAFFTGHFGMRTDANEIPSDYEIRSSKEFAGGLPPNNLTIAGLARKLAGQIARPSIPTGDERLSWIKSQREQLKSVIRYTRVSVENAWRVANTKQLGLESLAYRFDFSNGLSATGVWLKAISTQAAAPVTIVLSDKGYKTAGEIVSEHVNRGEQVLALDLLFNGGAASEDWEMLFATTGDRPLGLEATQLLGVRTGFGPVPII